MDVWPIRTEEDYTTALAEIEPYFINEPALGSPEADRFDVLTALIGAYEREHWAIAPPSAVDAIRSVMEDRGYSRADLANLLGSRSRASEILNRKRSLTVDQIRRLHEAWHIPAEALIAS
jgi:HTH-type transcriptional regulator/antitoxin HigA